MKLVISLLLVALLLETTGSEACSVLQFHWSGLAAHISGLWDTLPALYGSNGSVYIDNTEFPYRCTEQGGWHDFFETDDCFLQPWTSAVADTHQCQYYTYGEMSRASQEIGISHIQSRFDPGMVRKASPSLLSYTCSGALLGRGVQTSSLFCTARVCFIAGGMILLLDGIATCQQSWKLKASIQKDVDTALAVLDSYEKPTIAIHGDFRLHESH